MSTTLETTPLAAITGILLPTLEAYTAAHNRALAAAEDYLATDPDTTALPHWVRQARQARQDLTSALVYGDHLIAAHHALQASQHHNHAATTATGIGEPSLATAHNRAARKAAELSGLLQAAAAVAAL